MPQNFPFFRATAIFVGVAGFCHAQEAPKAIKAPTEYAASSAIASTNSMEVLDDKRKICPGDRLSYRVVEEQKPPAPLYVTDSGEIEVPLIGRINATNKTCRQLAYDIKTPLEKEYFYKATVIVGLDFSSSRSRGRIYITGEVRGGGPMEIPADETFTVSKALLRAGGFGDFANKRKVRLVRKKAGNPSETETIYVDVEEIIEKGRQDKDPVLNPDDMIVVPKKLINF
ncbi:MAG: polysaccharide biosynthesis/export family protein [Verrucomicrobiota bacterium]